MGKPNFQLLDAYTKSRWQFAKGVFGATVGWWVFLILITRFVPLSTIEAVGAGALGGALLTWTGLIIQYFYRKSPSEKDKGD